MFSTVERENCFFVQVIILGRFLLFVLFVLLRKQKMRSWSGSVDLCKYSLQTRLRFIRNVPMCKYSCGLVYSCDMFEHDLCGCNGGRIAPVKWKRFKARYLENPPDVSCIVYSRIVSRVDFGTYD